MLTSLEYHPITKKWYRQTIVTKDPPPAAPENVLLSIQPPTPPLPSVAEQSTVVPQKYEWNQDGAKDIWTRPKGKGYPSIDLAVQAAMKAGLKVGTGEKVHVMEAESGGWQVVGTSREEKFV